MSFHSCAVSLLTALVLIAQSGYLQAHKNHEEKTSEAVILAPGYEALKFEAPTPGSYSLPAIKPASDGKVVTHDGLQTSIHRLIDNRISLLSFIYTSCDDVNGCPLASFVLSKVDKRVQADPRLRNQTRLLSVSFDHKTDTIDTLANYAKGFVNDASSWKFLRAESATELSGLLKNYDQSIVVEPDGSTLSHILRVFLVDSGKNIRNVYSVSFLHADTVVSDLLTLLNEQDSVITATASTSENDNPKTSKALNKSPKRKIDLLRYSRTNQLGLPSPPDFSPRADNQIAAQIALGKRLFFDRRLSLNDTISCAMCHIPEQGFTSNELKTAIGIEGRTVKRNTPTLLNIGYMKRLFHDAREFSLENQVWSPLLAKNEMANPSIGFVLEKLANIEDYQDLFKRAFPNHGLTMQSVGRALAAYQKTLNAADSEVDKLLYDNNMSASENKKLAAGLALFRGKAGCAACHTIDNEYALFTDHDLHNTGIGYLRSMGEDEIFKQVLIAPGQSIEVHKDDIGPNALDSMNDLGRYEVTEDPSDRWKYRTPSLRNVALTPPYMHNGSLPSLRAVVEFYNRGGIPNPELDPLIRPLNLSAEEIDLLIYFLNGLTSPHAATLIEDARATPIGERN